MIVSKEQSWSCDAKEEDNRETVRNFFISLNRKLNHIHFQKLNCSFLNPTLLFSIQTDIHLHCEKWDQALSEEDWEPEAIVAEMPEFLQFMRQVQEFVSSHSHRGEENA